MNKSLFFCCIGNFIAVGRNHSADVWNGNKAGTIVFKAAIT